jgi:glycosyltransferase involved in cell wall biosynthesis
MNSETTSRPMPTASVVLPAYNSERFLREALDSVLAQSFRDFELIVIDDCSRDGTWNIIQEYAARDPRDVPLRNERNLNLARSLNRGIAAARGRYIVRMDHDDISVPHRLEAQIAFLEAHPEVGIVGSTMEIMDEAGRRTGMRRYNLTDDAIRRKIFIYSPFCHPATAMRKDVLDEVGPYDHAFNPAEDYELYFRIGMRSRFANLEEPLLRYRVVAGTSMTTSATRRLEAKTIEVRRKYARTPPYRMRLSDRAYNLLHYLSLFLVPSSLKSRWFARLRNS